jgi:RHS repeat-associated protein
MGSSTRTADISGGSSERQLYKAWGETRSAGTVGTKYQYTGQYSYTTDFGLHFFRSRWFDSLLGRFAQADTVVPLASQGVQAWDRYAGMNNNPVRYSDPSGHQICTEDGDCFEQEDPYYITETNYKYYAWKFSSINIKFTGDWPKKLLNKVAVLQAIALVGKALARGSQMTAQDAFIKAFGDTMRFEWDPECYECRSKDKIEECGDNFSGDCGAGGAYTVRSTHIKIASLTGGSRNDKDRMTRNIIHELGHAYNAALGGAPTENMPDNFPDQRELILMTDIKGRPDWQQNTTKSASETWADMFVAWTYNVWNDKPKNQNLVREAQTWMSGWMP